MSFSRAKINRFNDKPSGTPSPADYNVSFKTSSSRGITSKSERFPEFQSPASSDNCSTSGNNTQPTFRTPNPPKKIKCPLSRKPKPEVLFNSSDELDALREKTVECTNKDLYIQELSEHIEEMKQEISDLKKKICTLSEDKAILQTHINDLNEDNKTIILYKNQLHELENKFKDMVAMFHQLKIICGTIKTKNESDLTFVLNNISTLKDLFDTLKSSYDVLVLQKQEEINVQLRDLKEAHHKEIQQLETDMLKTVTHMHNLIEEEKQNSEMLLKECCSKKDKEISLLKSNYQVLQDDFEAKVKQLKENHKEVTTLSEIQMKEKYEDIERGWKMKMEEIESKTEASLKEYQVIAERNAIETEIEKEKILNIIALQKKEIVQLENIENKIKGDYNSLQNEHDCLRGELSKIIIELNTVREEHAKELQKKDISINQAIRDKYLYELTIQKTHKTVEALKNRLLKSDTDVEQLKAELEATEGSKLEVEGKCNQLMDELEIVTGLYDIIEEQNQLSIKGTEEKIRKLEAELLNKVDSFNIQANEKLKVCEEELCKKKQELKEVVQHLHEQQALNSEAQGYLMMSRCEIERLELLVNEYSSKLIELESDYNDSQEQLISLKLNNTVLDENSKLKTVIELMQASESDLLKQISDFNHQLRQKDQQLDETTKKLKATTELEVNFNKMVQKMQILEEENVQLRKTVCDQDALIGPFRANLHAYEKEYSLLLSEKENVEKEVKEISLKYAEILGHQNRKQKIKYMVDLKKRNFKLQEGNKQMDLKTKAQAQLIQQLQSEIATLKKSTQKNKENVGNLNSSRINSPGPLKELKENLHGI